MRDLIPFLVFAVLALVFDVVVGRVKRKLQNGPLDWEKIQREYATPYESDVENEEDEEEPQEIYVGGLPYPSGSRSLKVRHLEDVVRAAQLQAEEERSRELKPLESADVFEGTREEDRLQEVPVGIVPTMIAPSVASTMQPAIRYDRVQSTSGIDRHDQEIGSITERATMSAGKKAAFKPVSASRARARQGGLKLTPATARQAIVLMEVLGPPKAMQ